MFLTSPLLQQDLSQLAKELQPHIKRWFSDTTSENPSPATHEHPPRLVTSQPRKLHGVFIDIVDMIDGIKAVSRGNRDAASASMARANRPDVVVLGICALHDDRVLYTDFEPECTWNLVLKSNHCIANEEPSDANTFPRYQVYIPDHELSFLQIESAVHTGVNPITSSSCRTEMCFAAYRQLMLTILIDAVEGEAGNESVKDLLSYVRESVRPRMEKLHQELESLGSFTGTG